MVTALTYANFVLFLIAHLAGLVVGILLLVKAKSTPAILATVAFALSLIQDIGAIMRTAFLDQTIFQALDFDFKVIRWVQGGLGCCCGLFDLIAVVCLIVAIWQAVSAIAPAETEESAEAAWEGAENIE
jgi:hypothetical protein